MTQRQDALIASFHGAEDKEHNQMPAFMAWLQSEDGAAAAASDGVLLDTLVFLVES
jgi:hypothetical protein